MARLGSNSISVGRERRLALSLVPCHGPLEAFRERDSGPEAKLALRPARVELAAGLAVRFRGVPGDPAAKCGGLGDALDQLANADLERGSQIHRLGLVVTLRRQHDPLGSVLHIEKLPRCRSVTPHDDLLGALVASVQTLLDER